MPEPSDHQIEQILNSHSSVAFVRGDDLRNTPVCVMSGSFNPIHAGHREMARFGSEKLNRETVFELCVANADKPQLSVEETKARINQDFGTHPLALTRAPTFLEKAAIFPGATFLVGVDTMYRVALPRFYEDDDSMRDMAISELGAFGCRFLVFGREIENKFIGLSELPLPPKLQEICDEVSQAEFESSLSSTKLRQQDQDPS